LITEQTQTVALEKSRGCPVWVQANDQANGYYRVDYRGGLLSSLVSGDVQKRLSAAERADLLGNAEALARSGKMQAGEVLSLVETFHDDPDRYVVRTALSVALDPRAHLVPEKLMPNYSRFLLKNFQTRAGELGWSPKPGESDDVQLLRALVVRPVATYGGDMELAGQAKDLANRWFSDHSAVNPNMLSSVLGTAAYYGDKALFERMLAEYKRTNDKQLRQTLLGAMTSFRETAVLTEGMNAVVNGAVPFIEGAAMLFAGRNEPATRKLSFEFVKSHWEKIVQAMPTGGGFDFGSVLPDTGASFCDSASRDELKAFFEPKVKKYVGAPRALDQAIEGIDLCIANKAAQESGVAAFLAKY
jgi:aminopeptidase N